MSAAFYKVKPGQRGKISVRHGGKTQVEFADVVIVRNSKIDGVVVKDPRGNTAQFFASGSKFRRYFKSY